MENCTRTSRTPRNFFYVLFNLIKSIEIKNKNNLV